MSDLDRLHGPDAAGVDDGGRRSLGRDVLGLALFAIATLLGVSAFMSATRPAEDPQGTTAFFTALARLLGAWPLILFALTLSLLGGRLWVAGEARGLARHLLGALASTLALSVLCGAALEGAGGGLGDLIGGGVSRQLTPFVSIPLGLALLGTVVWAVWLRPPFPGLARGRSASAAPPRVELADSGGLSADEAAALLPPEGSSMVAGAGPFQEKEPAPPREKAGISGRSIPIAPDLKPLYPPDVRLQGGIPEGTRPLETRDSTQPQTSRSAAPAAASAPRPGGGALEPRAGPGAGADRPAPLQRAPGSLAQGPERPPVPDLAPGAPRWEAVRGRLGNPAEASPREVTNRLAAGQAAPLAAPAQPLAPSWEEGPAEPAAAAGVAAEELPEPVLETGAELAPEAAQEIPVALPPRPGWEQPGLFDEEPVDAYGTPVSLVEALRESNQQSAARIAGAEEELAEEEAELGGAAAEAGELAGADSEEEDEGGDREEDVEEFEDSDVDELDAEEGGEDEEDELYAGTDEEEDEEGDEEGEGEGELLEHEREDEAEEGDEREPWTEEEALEDAEEEPGEQEHEVLRAQEREGPADDETPSSGSPGVQDATEPEVVLAPRPPKRKAASSTGRRARPVSAAVSPAGPDPAADLLYRAGVLFVERGRVAVSMLQREFQLDFKQATSLLDQLQEAGLIGPYLGGQRRDILLTLEEWRERRVGTS